MPLKLNSTGGGSVTLDVGSTASNYTLTLPNQSGSLMPIATTTNNGVVYVNSSGAVTSGSGLVFDGSVLTVAGGGLNLGAGGVSGYFSGNTWYGMSTGDWNLQAGNGSQNFVWKNSAGTERMRLDSSGNLGLGVTPSAWDTVTMMQVKNASFGGYSGSAYVNSNAFYQSGWKYITSNYASRYEQTSGQHQWHIAPSGTAGNAISFTQAMTLDASGNLGVGNTSPTAKVDAAGTYRLQLRTDDTIPELRSITANGSAFKELGLNGLDIRFNTSNTERMRIDSSGNLCVGSSSAWYGTSGRGNVTISGSTSAILGFGVGGVANGYLFSYSGAVELGAPAGANLIFNINGEKARIDSSGNVGIGYTSPTAKLMVASNEGAANCRFYNNNNGGYWTFRLQGDGGSANKFNIDNNSLSTIFALTPSGAVQTPYIGNNTGSALVLDSNGYIRVNSSSRRYKENIEPIDVGLAEVMQMEPVKYNLKETGGAQIGFIAEDFPEPRLVNYSLIDPLDPEKGEQVESVNYANLTAILVKAVQELKAELDELKAKVK